LTTAASPREQEAVRFALKLDEDFALWARTCYRIRNKRLELEPFRLNRVQLAIEAAEAAELAAAGRARLNILKGRQGGVTTHQQARSLHLAWSRPHCDALTLAHSKDDTGKIFEITRRAIDNFPPALLPRMGAAGTYEVSFPSRDSRFWTGTAGSKGPGRGLTLVRVHGSEFAYWNDPRSTLGALSPGLEGVPGSVIVLESTASGYGSDAHAFWQQTVKGETGYRALFFPWWQCDPENYRIPLEAPDELGELTEPERGLVKRHGLTLEEIKWRRRQIRHYGMGGFLKEYPEDDEGCWLVAGDPFYNRETLLVLAQRVPRPVAYIPAGEREPRPWLIGRQRQDGEILIYGEPAPGDRGLILGADIAEGLGGDGTAYVLRGFPSWRLIEECISRTIEPAPFAALLDRRSRGRTVYMVVEKNFHGITVLRELRDAGYPRKLIYHRPVLDDRNPESRTDRMGWATTGGPQGSHSVLLDAGRDLFHEALEGNVPCPSADVIRDAFAVQRDKNGTVSLTGRDLLVSELLAWMGRTAPRG